MGNKELIVQKEVKIYCIVSEDHLQGSCVFDSDTLERFISFTKKSLKFSASPLANPTFVAGKDSSH